MHRSIRFGAMSMVVATATLLGAQSPPQSAPATAPQARGRNAARGPRYPNMVQDPETAQWYSPMQHADYAFGVDVSSLRQTEMQGRIQFKDNGQAKPALEIFKDHGFNWVRVRVCHEPATLPQTTAYTVAAAKEAKKLGFKVLLDFHYSAGWADPTNEPMIPEWRDLSHEQRVKALFEYTRDTVAAFAKEDALPEIIQVGNEVSNGFLWPAAKLPEKWDDFAGLIYAGINGIDAGRGNGKRPKIMIHVDHGGDIPKTRAFFDKLNSYDIPYDLIGFSFYPWSHGTLLDLKANLTFTANTYHKDIYLVETGYFHSPSQYFRQTPGPFPETPEGQAQWMEAVNKIVMDTPDNRGKGIFYWEPTSVGGGLGGRAYFDAQGNALPVMNVFQMYARPVHRTDDQ